jgi:hypothetical protein
MGAQPGPFAFRRTRHAQAETGAQVQSTVNNVTKLATKGKITDYIAEGRVLVIGAGQ